MLAEPFPQNTIYPDQKKGLSQNQIFATAPFYLCNNHQTGSPAAYTGYKYPTTSFAGVIAVTVICGSGEPW